MSSQESAEKPVTKPDKKTDKDGPKKVTQSRRGFQLVPLLTKLIKVAGLMIPVYLAGYFRYSSAWMVTGLFAYFVNDEYKARRLAKKEFLRQSSKNEEAAIICRVDELPSWVYFPDVERAEWLNKMIRQMWPFIGEYSRDLLIKTVEPQVQNSLPKTLKPFKFLKIDMGDIPPRIGGVKVYVDNVKRDEIIMDLELCYASDSMFKVAVKGMNAGIKEFSIHGTMRVEMKPLCNKMPIIGALNAFFLNPPEVDFDMTNVANVLDLPLLSNSLRSVVEDQISHYLVLPNKIPIKLVEDIDMTQLLFPQPQGVLRFHVVAARELIRADFKLVGKGKSDPYCKIFVGAQSFKTKVIQDSINPVWNEYFEAVIEQKHGQFMEIECLDEDPGDDDELGTCSIDIGQVAHNGTMDSWLPLENVKSGMVHIRALWLHISKDPEDLDKEEKLRHGRLVSDAKLGMAKMGYKDRNMTGSEEHMSSALLILHLDSAKSLPRSKRSMVEPSAYVKFRLGNEERKSVAKPKSTDPKWEENFEFLIHDINVQNLDLEVLDSARNDKKLGTFSYSLKNLLTAKDLTVDRPFKLSASGQNTVIHMRLSLRILTSEAPPAWTREECDEELCPASPAEPEADTVKGGDTMADANDNVKPSNLSDVTPERNAGLNDMVIGGDDNISSVSSLPGQEVRHRLPTSSSSTDSGLGRIQVTIRFSVQRNKLIVVIHKCMNLIACDEDNYSDPYVRIYPLPNKSSSYKRKTQTVKNDLNPIFDETFEWDMSLTEAASKTLDITVKNSVRLFSSNRVNMGNVMIDLSRMDLTKASTEWYDFQDAETRESNL